MSNSVVGRGAGGEEEIFFDQVATLFEQIADITSDMKDDIRVLKERGTDPEKGILTTGTLFYTDCSASSTTHQLSAAVAVSGLTASVPSLDSLRTELNNPTNVEQDIIDWANGTYTGD